MDQSRSDRILSPQRVRRPAPREPVRSVIARPIVPAGTDLFEGWGIKR